jgi:TRAP-type C4-dicarboxylate transport system permease small subunit
LGITLRCQFGNLNQLIKERKERKEKVMEAQNRLVKQVNKYVIFKNLLNSIDKFVKIVCNILFGVMTFAIFIQVFCRLIGRSFIWTEELARYVMIWGAFIGASSLIRTWENVYVDFLIEKLSPKLKKIMYLFIKLVVFTFMIYITYITLKIVPSIGFYQQSSALQIPMFWAYLGILIGLILVIVQLLGTILNDLLNGEGNS